MDNSFEVYAGHAQNSYSQEALRERVDWLCGAARGRVLDVGCSQGINVWLLAHKGLQVTGIDNDPQAIAWARNKFEREATDEAKARADFICSDFSEFSSIEMIRAIRQFKVLIGSIYPF